MKRFNKRQGGDGARLDDILGKPEGNSYPRWVLGVDKNQASELSRPKSRKNHHTVVIKIPAPDTKAIKIRLRRLKRALIKSAFAVMVIAILIFGARYGLRLLNDRRSGDSSNNVAPKEVYVPSNLPDGFSVAGNSQSLDNGALLYHVYGPEGRLITITQQARPSDFNMEIFKNAHSFDTSLGKGYIIEDTSRITGYIITTNTMLLFNSTANIDIASLQTLMQAFNP